MLLKSIYLAPRGTISTCLFYFIFSSREAIYRDQFQTKRLALNIFTSFFLACKYDMDLMLLNCNFLVSRFPSQNKILHSGKRVLYFTTKAGYTRYGQPLFFGLTFYCSDFPLFFHELFLFVAKGDSYRLTSHFRHFKPIFDFFIIYLESTTC